MNGTQNSALVWFRRDLRLVDNTALQEALRQHAQVYCCFVFDPALLIKLPSDDRRVAFIWHSIQQLDAALRERGGALIVRHADPLKEIPLLASELGVATVYANRDYEPQTIARDAAVAASLDAIDIAFQDYKDQVIFEHNEVLTQGGTPFAVFTPYKNAWLRRLDPADYFVAPVDERFQHLALCPLATALPTLEQLGFRPSLSPIPAGMSAAQERFTHFCEQINRYAETRDFPAQAGTSGLSIHLRFGTISIRQLVAFAHAQGGRGAETWLSELIWREFYMMILWHHPQVIGHSYKAKFDALKWDTDQALWLAWCEGKTGYPLIDAAMRELVETGAMHNRLRMVTASFLVKDLGLDWRRGEAFFAQHLNDFDLAANNGGWQWCASTGCDAQPWFRIFNPVTQSEKFDADGAYIRRHVPELAQVPNKLIHAPWKMKPAEQTACAVIIGQDYPQPVVDHAAARERTLARYQAIR